MAENWYPIVGGGCTKCLACTIACPTGNLTMQNGQINLTDSKLCPQGCEACKIMCLYKVISMYDGTTESILAAFTGSCKCGCGGTH